MTDFFSQLSYNFRTDWSRRCFGALSFFDGDLLHACIRMSTRLAVEIFGCCLQHQNDGRYDWFVRELEVIVVDILPIVLCMARNGFFVSLIH